MATATATCGQHNFARPGHHPQPLDEMDLDAEMGHSFARQISPNCRLVDCKVPSPTCADPPDDTRLDFGEFKRRALLLATEFFCSGDVEGMVASIKGLGCTAFHDELAALLLRASLDQREKDRCTVVPLLAALHDAGLLSTAQLSRGFEKLVLAWEDLQLDVPGAPGLLVSLLSSRVGLFDRSLFARLPEDLLVKVCAELPASVVQRTIRSHLEELTAFKVEMTSKVEHDLLRTGNPDGLAHWLREECKPAFHHEVVVAACLSSFNGQPMADAFWMSCFDTQGLRAEKSRLVLEALVQLSQDQLLSETDIQIGFSRVLGIVTTDLESNFKSEDLTHLVALLRAAVEKELLAAQFLKIARRLRFGGSMGVEALRTAQRQTPLHSRRVWGTGDLRQMRTEMHDTIEEYFDSRSTEELAQVLEELHLSAKEQVTFLRKLLVAGMERKETEAVLFAVQELLGFCWSEQEVEGAFHELRDIEKDLVLDFPDCRECTGKLVRTAVEQGLLKASYLAVDATTHV
eukprot:s1231_g7.t1